MSLPPQTFDAPSVAPLFADDLRLGRSRCIQELCEESDVFIELVLDRDGHVMDLNATLARRLGLPLGEPPPKGLSEHVPAPGREWLLQSDARGRASRLLHFIDDKGHPFSARVKAVIEGDQVRLLGLITTTCSVHEQEMLHTLNNELAVTSRELARQRRQLEGLVAEARAREQDLMAAYQTIERVARTDPLTGLCNRRVLDDELPRVLERAHLTNKPVAVLVIDLDHFKRINDLFGHDAGDRVLADVSAVLRRNTRESDLAVRLGGEELMLVLPGVARERAVALAGDLRHQIAVLHVSGTDRCVTASIGVATWRGPDEPLASFLARADAAMYRAKAEGRDRCVAAID